VVVVVFALIAAPVHCNGDRKKNEKNAGGPEGSDGDGVEVGRFEELARVLEGVDESIELFFQSA